MADQTPSAQRWKTNQAQTQPEKNPVERRFPASSKLVPQQIITQEQKNPQIATQISGDQALRIPKCRVTKNRLEIDGSLTFEEWKQSFLVLRQASISVQFWIGDLINYGKDKFGRETIVAVLEEYDFKYKQGTKNDFSWVARQIEPSLRKENLSFSHHKEVTGLSLNEKEYWLEKAEQERLSVRELRNEIRLSKKAFNPSIRSNTNLTSEMRMEKTEELKKFIRIFTFDMKKVITDAEQFQKYGEVFNLKEDTFRDFEILQVVQSLYEKTRQLINNIKENGKDLY